MPRVPGVSLQVQFFITAMDAIRLNLEAKDQLFPLISDILTSLNRCTFLTPTFEPKVKLQNWYVRACVRACVL